MQERLLLTLPASKTDLFRQGILLTISVVGGTSRAVTAFHYLTSRWPAEPHAPLFSSVPFHSFAADHGLESFDRGEVAAKLRGLFLQEGVPRHYSGLPSGGCGHLGWAGWNPRQRHPASGALEARRR